MALRCNNFCQYLYLYWFCIANHWETKATFTRRRSGLYPLQFSIVWTVRPHKAVTEPRKRSPQTIMAPKVGRTGGHTAPCVLPKRSFPDYVIALPLPTSAAHSRVTRVIADVFRQQQQQWRIAGLLSCSTTDHATDVAHRHVSWADSVWTEYFFDIDLGSFSSKLLLGSGRCSGYLICFHRVSAA